MTRKNPQVLLALQRAYAHLCFHNGGLDSSTLSGDASTGEMPWYNPETREMEDLFNPKGMRNYLQWVIESANAFLLNEEVEN